MSTILKARQLEENFILKKVLWKFKFLESFVEKLSGTISVEITTKFYRALRSVSASYSDLLNLVVYCRLKQHEFIKI